MARRVRITGERGRWLAQVEGRWLPVIHDTWRRGPTGYHDPMNGVKTDGKRYREVVEALGTVDLVIMQKDKPGSFDRQGYIGVFTFNGLKINDDGPIDLTLTGRYADPSNP